MPTKAQIYAQMAEEAARQVTGSRENWTSFLTTAARLYKYPYHEQLMIHKQRPEATACAEYDFWNERMGRYVKRGSKGIALVVYNGNKPHLRYVFDVADTGGRKNSRPVKLWTMEDEYRQPVMDALERSYGVPASGNTLEDQLETIARQLATEYWNDFGKNILGIVEDSFLMEYDEYNIGVSFRNAATVSITYALYSRCCGNPDDYFEHEDFLDIFDFNTRQTANYLGTAVSELSSRVFREIEVTIRNYERMKQAERSQNNERDHLQAGRGLSDSRDRVDAHGGQAPGQVRENAPGLPGGAQPHAAERPDSQRAAVPASVGDRRDSTPAGGAVDGRIAGAEPRTGQGYAADGVGAAHEQPEGAGRGNRDGGAGQQLSLFLSEAEQIRRIDEAESKKPSAFSFSQEQIDQMLILGGNVPDIRMMVALEYMKGKSPGEIAKRLPEIYRGCNGFKLNGAEASVWFDEQCIHIARGKTARFAPSRQVISWQEAAERIGSLLESGEYATNVELVEAPGYERTRVAESLWYLVHDLSESGRAQGYLASLQEVSGGGFPDETKALAEKLADSQFYSVLVAEYQRFLDAYREDRSVLRFHYHKVDRLGQQLEELSLPLREYQTEMAMAPVVPQFITDDEINEALSGGSGFEGGKARIYEYWQTEHSAQDKANFLKNEYGMGGHTGALSGAFGSDETHDSKGIRYTKKGCDKVQLSWAQVVKRIDALMEQGRYFSQEALAQYQQQKQASEPAIAPAQEPEEWEQVDGAALRERLEQQDSPFVEQVMRDVAALAGEQESYERFSVIETDDGYAIWDDIRDEIYVDEQGVSEEFTSEWQANDYLQEVRKAVAAKESAEWQYVERSKVAAEAEALEDQPVAGEQGQVDTPTEQSLSEAMQDAENERTPVGCIEYLGTNGMPGEVVEYTDEEQFIKTIQDDTFYGVPLTVVLYRDEQGRTISQDFLQELDPPPKGFRVEDAPVLTEERSQPLDGPDYSAEYRLLDRLRSDCEYFLGEGQRNEKHLWAGHVSEQIAKMRELYELLPEKPDWLTKEAIDSYAERMAAPYLVVVYHHFENGFDERADYQTLEEAENVAQKYVSGEMEVDGFQYDGAAIYDMKAHRYVRIIGDYPDPLAHEQISELSQEAVSPAQGQEQAADTPSLFSDETTQLPDLKAEVEAWEAEQAAQKQAVIDTLSEWQKTIVQAMETAGFIFAPQMANPGLNENLVFTSGEDDYPMVYETWEQVYEEINNAALKNHPGLREKVQAILHPMPESTILTNEEFSEKYLIPGQTAVELDGRTFRVESVDLSIDKVELRDVTFANAVGFPIFRVENIGTLRRLLEPELEKAESDVQQPDHFIDHYYVVEDLQVRGALQLTEYSTFAEAMEAYQALPTDKLKALGVQNTRKPLPGSLDLIQCKDGQDTLIFDYTRVEGWKNPEILNLVEGIDVLLRENLMARFSAENYHITDDHLGEGGAKLKYVRNVAAIRTLFTLEQEGRNPTPQEQEILANYVGWGGLADAFDPNKPAWAQEYANLKSLLPEREYEAARASTLNAHFTSPTVIRAIYDAVGRMGFENGNILEPSMGVGNFFGVLPPEMRNSQLYGVELDSITGRIAQKLYPKAEITVAGFETTDRRDFFDLAVGNVPFGNYKVADKPYDKLGFSIHNYFFAKTLDQVRPGGVIAFVTSRYTMDSKNMDARKYIAQRAELLGAIRLPNNAFRANAGTEVVSDIIFLQKRDHPIDTVPDWVHLNTTPDGFAMNSYFVEHPEMVLGELTTESTQYGKEDLTVRPREGVELSELLQEAVTHIQGTYTPVELMADEESQEKEQVTIPARPDVKNFSYTVVDGEVYFRENSVMRLVDLNDKAKERVCGMVELRRIVGELMEYQLEDYPDEAITQKQQELSDAYDAFTASNGLINSKANEKAFADDSAYYLLCSLENVDEDGNLKSKADMFTKRTIRPEHRVTSVDTPAEALAVCIGERGKVDLPFMAQLLGTEDTARIAADLRGVIFRIPEPLAEGSAPRYVTADEYLSGNVREKLRQAQMAVQISEEYRPNLEALEQAQPKDLDASEIDVRLGATWIDADYIQQFMQEVFETPYYLRRNIEVKFSDITAEWRISGKSSPSHNDVAAYMTYGTDRDNAYRILEETLNLKDIRIYDTIEDADGKQRRVLNKKQTTLAQQKQQAIKDAFRDWIWKDPRRREALVTKYNELFNSTRPREYNGDHIVFGGMNPDITLREHQKNAIAHVLYGGNTLLAHEVGAGKTFEMVASAMESKRLGLCQKSLFVVPNHLTTQWASEFLRLYPSANILVTTKKDFEPQNRKKFCARIATGDYDAVIIGHSQFEKIPLSAERQERQLREQIDEIEGAIAELKWQRGENFSIKQMEKTRKSLQTRLDKLLANDRKDDVVTFEQLGVDRLFVDESHAFKNLFLYTKMRNVAGLSTSEAQKSSDMFIKCRYLDEITGGRGVIFATGTPVSNSMTELYTVMRYLQYATLQKKNLTHFDCWASTFGETTTAIELAPEGTGYRARTRFAKFFNLPELMNMFKEVADIKTSDQLHLPVPDAKFETVVVEPSEHQQDMVAELSERAAAVHSGVVDPSVDNMLKITSDGRKLGLDQRLMNPLLPDDPNSKLNACVRNVLRIWEEGKADKLTQLLFCDLSTPKNDGTFNVYDDIKAKLMAAGVPEKEIAFIHTADTEVKKKELFAKVRTGQVRVLLGSTQKMGAGTNCQDRLVALHHLDVGWRPSDMTQRNGRIIRQGNMNKEVQVYQYVTEGTFDAYLYQTLENKQKFISQIMTSKSPVRSCDDVDEQALSYAEIKALCAGNPLIKEKMDLDIEVARLKVLKADHQSQQYRIEDKLLKYFPAEIERQQGYIQGFEADMQTVAAHPQIADGFCGMELLGKHYTEKTDAGEMILAACKEVKSTEPVSLGTYRGFAMELSFDSFRHEFDVVLKGAMSHRVALGTDARGNITRLDNALAAVPDRLEKAREQLTNLQNQQEATRAELGKPFPQEAELAQKSARLAELDAELNMDDKSASEHAEERPSVLADLKSKSERIPPAKRSEEKEEVL